MKELPLSRGRVALVDDDVWEWASGHRWYVHPQGYVYRKSSLPNGKRGTSLLRREIMQPPPGAEVAHRNEDQLDHRRENLVVFTPAERAAHKAVRVHREGLRATNTSGFRGVSCGREWRVTSDTSAASPRPRQPRGRGTARRGKRGDRWPIRTFPQPAGATVEATTVSILR